MKCLELFAGSCTFTNEAKRRNWITFATDLEAFAGIDYAVDIRRFDVTRLPFKPDLIWASPPCTAFSVASIGRHWNLDGTPKSREAELGLEILQATVELIDRLKPKFWFIENPRGMMRNVPMMAKFQRQTITYCQYGETRMKPTDIWTNAENPWIAKPHCKNGDPCHESAPRGAKTGTQGLKDAYERAKIPVALASEVLDICERRLLFDKLFQTTTAHTELEF